MAEKINAELLGKQLWSEVHDEIEKHEDNYDEDGNLRYSEKQFVEMFQEIKDHVEGRKKMKLYTLDELFAKMDEWTEEVEAEEERKKLSASNRQAAIFR